MKRYLQLVIVLGVVGGLLGPILSAGAEPPTSKRGGTSVTLDAIKDLSGPDNLRGSVTAKRKACVGDRTVLLTLSDGSGAPGEERVTSAPDGSYAASAELKGGEEITAKALRKVVTTKSGKKAVCKASEPATQSVRSKPETLTVNVVGDGSVTCNDQPCQTSYPSGTSLELGARPGNGWEFNSWGGDCTGSGTCTVTLNGPKSVTAYFYQPQPWPGPGGP